MSVGEEVIFQDENWSGGSLDNGIPKRSNAGISAIGVSYDGADPEGGESRNSLASHVLSSGEYIFDLSGNLWEWVEWEKDTDLAYPGECNTGGWVINSNVNCPAWNINSYRPIIPNSEISLSRIDNMGRIISNSGVTTRAVTRGAGFGNTSFAGIFAMWGSADRTTGYNTVGFRCVYRK
jgi:formylglycine-generating enzyme required for sulfatase activity